jgi:hypothetical protein
MQWWVLIGILQCLQIISSGKANTNRTCTTTANTTTCATSELDMKIRTRNVNDERRGILRKLIQTDSDRKERYKYLLRQIKYIHIHHCLYDLMPVYAMS